jgi:hypothetical protein
MKYQTCWNLGGLLQIAFTSYAWLRGVFGGWLFFLHFQGVGSSLGLSGMEKFTKDMECGCEFRFSL